MFTYLYIHRNDNEELQYCCSGDDRWRNSTVPQMTIDGTMYEGFMSYNTRCHINSQCDIHIYIPTHVQELSVLKVQCIHTRSVMSHN